MDGKAIFVIGIERGWTSKAGVRRMDKLTRVESDGKSARGYTKVTAETSMFFVKESGGWKIAMFELLKPLNRTLKNTASENGMSEDQFIQAMLTQARQTQGARE